MVNNFAYSLPVKLNFGIGLSEKLDSIICENGFSRGVLICDKLFESNGVAQKIKNSAPSIVEIFSDITPNPMLSEVNKATEILQKTGADFAVALGGGSSMDLAKFACSMLYAEYPITDYFYKRKVFQKSHLPLIVMPTTAGTGSEVTAVSVCNDDANNTKAPLLCENFYPYLAVLDPALTLTVPPFVTATTGLDAMSHALEGFWSINHQPICDLYAKESLKLLFANLEQAYFHGEDIEARSAISLGALYAGLAFSQPKTAAVHGCSYPLSTNYHLCHGEACAFTLDMFLLENATVDTRLEELALSIGFENVKAMADKIASMKKQFCLKTKLNDLENLNIAKLASDCVSHPLFNNNPKKYTAEVLEITFKKYYD